jgi:hypothetical protein
MPMDLSIYDRSMGIQVQLLFLSVRYSGDLCLPQLEGGLLFC